MVKKVFDSGNMPSVQTAGSQVTQAYVDCKRDIELSVEMLDYSDPEDRDVRMENLAAVLKNAARMMQYDWDLADKTVWQNIPKVDAPFDDDVLMDIIDIAIHDPKIGSMTKFMGIVKDWGFKKMADVPEAKSFMPQKALALLELAENYARPDSKLLSEIRTYRAAIDPAYELPAGAAVLRMN